MIENKEGYLSRTVEKDFYIAFNIGGRKNIDIAVARVAYYRSLPESDVRDMLKKYN